MTKSLQETIKSAPVEKRRRIVDFTLKFSKKNGEVLGDSHTLLLTQLLENVYSDATQKELSEASKIFARSENADPALMDKLAKENIAIASTVLRESKALTDKTLIDVIKTKTDDHRLSISQREVLSSAVTDSLLIHGNMLHYVTIVRNPKADISNKGFRHLAIKSRQETQLTEALSYRGDMPVEIASQLLDNMKPPMTTRLRGSIETTQKRSLGPKTKKDLILARERSGYTVFANKGIDDVIKGTRSTAQVTVSLCSEAKSKDLGQFLAGITELTEATVSSALFKLNGTKIAQICKTVEMSTEVFDEIIQLRANKMRLPLSQGELLLRQYDEMPLESAQRAVKSMQGVLNSSRSKLAAA